MAYPTATRRRISLWMVPLVSLLVILHWETRTSDIPSAPTEGASAAQPTVISTAVLPDYAIEGGTAARATTIQRTLFNPTRRPASDAVSETADAQGFKKGQFALVGSSVTNDRRVAFLRETASGRSRMVNQGEEINGMIVAEVSSEVVRLRHGSQNEDLRLAAPGKARSASLPPSLLPAVPAPQETPAGNPHLRGAPMAAPVEPALAEGEPPPSQD